MLSLTTHSNAGDRNAVQLIGHDHYQTWPSLSEAYAEERNMPMLCYILCAIEAAIAQAVFIGHFGQPFLTYHVSKFLLDSCAPCDFPPVLWRR